VQKFLVDTCFGRNRNILGILWFEAKWRYNNRRRGRTKVNTVKPPGCETAVIRIQGLRSDVAIPLACGRNISH